MRIITDNEIAVYHNHNFLLRGIVPSRILVQMKIAENLTNHFLIAMPSLNDAIFKKAVVYIYEHSSEGAMGIVVNKSLHITLGNLLQHLDIEVKDEKIAALPVLSGGPVGPEQGFVIHTDINEKAHKIAISASKETLRDISVGKGPKPFIIALGYAGWEGGQLEKEINRNDWLVAPFERKILFDTPLEKRWAAAAKTIGVDINQLSGQVGHA